MKKAVQKPPYKKWTPPTKKKAKPPAPPPPEPKPNEFQSLVNDCNLFSEECDKFLRDSTAINSVYSPFFVRNLLAMLRIGAADLSAFEIDRGIKLSTPPTDDLVKFAESLAKLMPSIQKLNKSGISLTVADRILIKSGFEVTPPFASTLRALFKTDVQQIKFGDADESAKAINNWFQEATQHHVPQILEPKEVNSFGDHTRIVLLNAIHFQGEWQNKFPRRSTYGTRFHVSDKKTVDCAMMVSKAPVFYADQNKIGCHAVGLPFKDGRLVMVILSSKLQPFDRGFNSSVYRYKHDINVNSLMSQMVETDMEIHLPYFTIESTTHFIQPLKHLGMRTIFDPTSANFSGITGYDVDGFYVSDVLQKVIVEFTDTEPEPDSEPAAKKKGARVQFAFRPFGAAKKKPKTVIMNHPFVFHIVDKTNSNLVLFSGLCSNPTLRTIETVSAKRFPRPAKYKAFSLTINQQLRKANIC